MKSWVVYLVQCADGSYYVGITNNLQARVVAHNKGLGAKYTRGRLPVMLICHSKEMSHPEAAKMERMVKRLPRKEKVIAVVNY